MTVTLCKISECLFSTFSKVCFKNSNTSDINMCLCREGLCGQKFLEAFNETITIWFTARLHKHLNKLCTHIYSSKKITVNSLS